MYPKRMYSLQAIKKDKGGHKMKFGLHNDNDGLTLIIDVEERELLYNALWHYSAYGERDSYILDQTPTICEILNVLHMKGFDKVK